MARGWESKSVQEQIESSRSDGEGKPGLSAEQLAVKNKRDSLLLHRTRVLHDLQRCTEERYRKTLNHGLAYLDEQLAALGWKPE